MKILVINGSPRGNNSNTLKITKAFLDGFNKDHTNDIEIIDVSKSNINHCLGCFSCWNRTPGKCVLEDDMNINIEKYVEADMIIWSFPLYYYGMPSKVKAFMDRLLPINLPFIIHDSPNTCTHPSRYEISNHKYLLISSCGFSSINKNYEALLSQFSILYGGDNFTKILCVEGPLLSSGGINHEVNTYLENVKKSGIEYKENYAIFDNTLENLSTPMIPAEIYSNEVNSSWENSIKTI